MIGSKLKMGWLFVMFDLPVVLEDEHRAATRFRTDLLDDGFVMVQFSVYARPCLDPARMEKHLARVKARVPPGGNVRAVFITDAQWGRSLNLTGETPKYRRPKEKMPRQLEFW